VSYRSGGQPAPLASVQAALAELLGALGCGRALCLQAGVEADPEKLQLYAQIIVKKAPADRKAAIVERLQALELL
jgi:hypothetical protein